MRSTTGEHYVALDHVRAFAALLVFCWHFLHGSFGTPISFDYEPVVFPLALFDEGHTGVALFMTLSGYLFAKLIRGGKRQVDYTIFFWNRAVRLFPLLFTVIGARLLLGAARQDWRGVSDLTKETLLGLVLPTLPNGGWSITVECHFYLLLPLLLVLLRRSAGWLVAVVALAIVLRLGLHEYHGDIRRLGYLTLVGRIDQFVAGILAFHFQARVRGRHMLAIATAVAFLAFYW